MKSAARHGNWSLEAATLSARLVEAEAEAEKAAALLGRWLDAAREHWRDHTTTDLAADSQYWRARWSKRR